MANILENEDVKELVFQTVKVLTAIAHESDDGAFAITYKYRGQPMVVKVFPEGNEEAANRLLKAD